MSNLRIRRVPQFAAGYGAGAWGVMEVIDQLVGNEIVPQWVYPLALVLVVTLAPGTVIIAWFHGEKGEQTAPLIEKWLLAGVASLALVSSVVVMAGQRDTARLAALAELGSGLDHASIGVLYFEDFTRSPDLAFVADGLTEALIDELTGVRGLSVISRNGSARFRGSDLPLPDIAQQLGTGSLITGSVDENGDRLSVAIELYDGATGVPIERQSIELPSAGMLAVRDSVVQEVSQLLRTRLGEEFRLREQRSGTESVDAWILVQRAEQALKESDILLDEHDDVDGAIAQLGAADSLLVLAEALDATWSEPLVQRARVADAQGQLMRSPLEIDPYMKAAIGHADRALELDPENADALEVRGTMKYLRFAMGLELDHDRADELFVDAEADLRASTASNPLQVGAWNILSHLLSQKDDPVAVNLAARQAYEADAFFSAANLLLWRLYQSSYTLEQHTQAVQWCEEGGRKFPDDVRFSECQLWLMTSRAREANPDEAWRLQVLISEHTPEHEREYTTLRNQIAVAAVLARADMADSARVILAQTRGNPEVDPARELLSYQAFAHTLLGDLDGAVSLLAEYLTANPAHRDGYAETTNWWWRPLQEHAGFKQLVGLQD